METVQNGLMIVMCSEWIVKTPEWRHLAWIWFVFSELWAPLWEVFYKKVFLKIHQNSQEKLSKKTSTRVFSCEFYDSFKNIYFVEQLRTAASETFISIFLKIVASWKLIKLLFSVIQGKFLFEKLSIQSNLDRAKVKKSLF